MQVSHQTDHITHAVLGSPESIEMAVTDSADFMIMMSSTLYTDQKLAVVREVLCNGWDAHIEAGVTETPLRITLTQDTMTIRDFGQGIPHDKIGPIYGIFGASTKQNDGMQTGGFGLGCKAPFAYVEHFQVTSYHQGVKTIYNMSKSSAQLGGKPGINKIVSLPTTETGLEVSIKIQAHDVGTFRNLIRRIVRNGEMKATLNDDPLEVLPFSQAKHNFLVLTDSPTGNHGERLFVRYGNVIYPIPPHAELNINLPRITAFLNTLPGTPVLVLQAPPHSISVAPSREALSMKEQTLKTLVQLTGDFIKLLNRHLAIEVVKVFDEGLARAVTEKLPHKVLTVKAEVPYVEPVHVLREAKQLASPAELAKYQISARYPELSGFRRREIRKRVEAAAAMGHISKPLAHTFLVEFRRDRYRKGDHTNKKGYWIQQPSPTWFHKRIVAPLVQALHGAGLPANTLMAVGHGHHPGSYERRVEKSSIMPALSAPRMQMSSYLLYLRQIVVLSHTNDPIDLLDASNWPMDQQKYGFLCYRVPVTAKRIEEARAFFATQSGLTVIDLLDDPEDVRARLANRTKAKEKKVGLLRADTALGDDGRWYDGALTRVETNKPRIAEPQWVCKAAARDRQGYWEPLVTGWDTETTTLFLQLFGKEGGFYTNVTQVKKLKALPIEVFAIRKVTEYIMVSDNLKQFFYVDPKRDDDFRYASYGQQMAMEELYHCIMAVPKLREHFGMACTLTRQDRQMLKLWRWLTRRSQYAITQVVPQAMSVLKYVSTLPFHPKRFVLKQLLKDRADILGLLDSNRLKARLTDDDPAVVDHVIKVLLTTLEG